MSVSQIMAAVERADRNAVDQLFYKMRKAGEIEAAGRGLYTLAGQDPINGGQIGACGSAPAQSGRERRLHPPAPTGRGTTSRGPSARQPAPLGHGIRTATRVDV